MSSAIFKETVKGSVLVRRLNLEGDKQADLEHHGGVCNAVYAYPFKHYAHWERELDREDFVYGQSGEESTRHRSPLTWLVPRL